MSFKNRSQALTGFSAVEVMIALIIASLFLFSAYQLFGIVHQSQLYARLRSEASNVAYAELRKATGTTFACPVGPRRTLDRVSYPTNTPNLIGLKATTRVSCPYGTTQKILKVEVEIEYRINGNVQKEIQALYVDKT